MHAYASSGHMSEKHAFEHCPFVYVSEACVTHGKAGQKHDVEREDVQVSDDKNEEEEENKGGRRRGGEVPNETRIPETFVRVSFKKQLIL